MDPLLLAALVAAAFLGGAQNAVAGGGTFLTFPLLIGVGLDARVANATSTVALWPGSLASVAGFREELRHERRTVAVLGLVSAVGGMVGALLLVLTPERTFNGLVPWLLLAATLIFALGPRLTRRTGPRRSVSLAALAAAQLPIAIYGGYFGAGIGILMLAMMAALGMEDIQAMNGLKAILGTVINLMAIAIFAARGLVEWGVALPMVAGAVLGGYAGARVSRRLDRRVVRAAVIAIGAILTVVFFVKAYG